MPFIRGVEKPAHAREALLLQGIVLVGHKDNVLDAEKLKTTEGVQIYGVDLPGSASKFKAHLTRLFLNKQWNSETLAEIKQCIYQYYQKEQRPFIIVSLPAQSYETNVLQLIIEESRLGDVEVIGNKWTPSQRIKDYFSLRPGEPISIRRLSRDINFINRDPFRFTNVIYKPGVQENTTDVTLDVSDHRPYQFYVGFNNTGVLATGRQRVFAGFSWDQVFGLDHVFFYQYTTNYNGQRFHANSFQYMALLPCKSILDFYGGFSLVHADISDPNKKNKGTNIQASARYQVPLYPGRFVSHEIRAGFDIKNTNNNMEFVDFTPVFGQTVNLTQLVLGYQVKRETRKTLIDGSIDVFWSPGAWIPHQTNSDFESLRPSAKNHWVYTNAFLKLRGPLFRSFSYEMFFQGQISSQVLLPSEQLPLGGYGSVRGYDVRQYNADTGFFANLEIHSPKFSVIRRKKPHPDHLHFLLFLDGGCGIDKVAIPEINTPQYLIGIGPGIRYSLGPYLTARCDWGIKLHQKAVFTGGLSMVYFSVIGRY